MHLEKLHNMYSTVNKFESAPNILRNFSKFVLTVLTQSLVVKFR